MIVCHCEAVNDRTVRAAVSCGAYDVDTVGDKCRAGTNCGGCHDALARILAESQANLTTTSAVA